MRAFLSHSSANKDFVADVFSGLGASNAEYDEKTFSAGEFNTQVIREALDRADIFVLFATKQSLSSGFVNYEINLANEYLAAKKIKRVLTFCLQDVSPEDLPHSIQQISAVRRSTSVGAATRAIKAQLIELQIGSVTSQNHYLGREAITKDIKTRLATPDEPTPVAIAFSGVDGVGRRTLADRVLTDVYPGTGRVHPSIHLNNNADRSDIYRGLLEVTGGITKQNLYEMVVSFDTSSHHDQILKIVNLILQINSLQEIIYIIDNGGLLDEKGNLSGDMKSILQELLSKTFTIPFIAFILFRTPPAMSREKKGVYYFRVDAIETEDLKNLVALNIKQRGQLASKEDIYKLVEMTDGHPYNLQFLLRLLDTHSIQSLLEDPSDLVAFKKRQGDDFIARLPLGPSHFQILAVLRAFGQASIELLGAAVHLSPDELGKNLKELEEFHCVERIGNICAINRPLRAAFERSTNARLDQDQIRKLQSDVIKLFNSYTNDDEVSIELVSAAARAAVSLNREDVYLKAFLSPSNSLFVARQLYDHGRYPDCARIAQNALASARFISEPARIEAIRLRCSSLARLGEDEAFMDTLRGLGKTDSEQTIKMFLEGFRLRLLGEPEAAVEKFRRSFHLNKTSFATLRELSHSLMQIGEIEEAKEYAEEALKIAPTNPYIIDQALALRVAERQKVSKDIIYDPSVESLLERLERYGDEEGKSFYAIRMADIMRRAGDLSIALEFATRASRLTPSLATAHITEAEILIKMKDFPTAKRKIEFVEKLIGDRSSGEGKSQLPEFLFLKANYLIEEENFVDAIGILKANERRLTRKLPDLRRRIAFSMGRDQQNLSEADRKWLSS